MSKAIYNISTGLKKIFTLLKYDRRKIIIAEGIEFHNSEIKKYSVIGFLKENLSDLIITSENPLKAEYTNHQQKVIYTLEVVQKKSEFKKALETEGIIVIYAGHSRYGRGACFDQYSGKFPKEGEQWENGGAENGLFRLAYDYVPVPLSDIKTHKYKFAPVPVKEGSKLSINKSEPYNFERVFRYKKLQVFTLPEEWRKFVLPKYISPNNKYYGFYKREEKQQTQFYILHAGWKDTQSPDYELDKTELRCKTFCHFGCSSRDHFWDIIRRPKYKGWSRPKPPTGRFAYFTTLPGVVWHYWTFFLLTFGEEYDANNIDTHWWKSHEYARIQANIYLKSLKQRIQVY